MSDKPCIERRQSFRIKLALPVFYSVKDRKRECKTENVSYRGFFVQTDHPLPVGTVHTFRLSLPVGDQTLSVVGRVKHINDSNTSRSFGMGVEIRQIVAGQEDAFEAYRALVEEKLYKL